jgi:RNA polymerase primary sigma factor
MNAVGRKAPRRSVETGFSAMRGRTSSLAARQTLLKKQLPPRAAERERAGRILELRLSYRICRAFTLLDDDACHRPPCLATLNENSLLSAEQETELFVHMHHCWFQADALRRRLVPRSPSTALLAMIESRLSLALEIRNTLLRVFLKLAVSLVGPFLNRQHPFEELYSEAAVALLRAVELYDPERGCRFSTYATTAIRRALERFVTNEYKRLRRCGAGELLDAAPAPHATTSVDDRRRAAAVETLDRMLAHLPDREQSILQARFGLAAGCQSHSLQQIADRLGISRERVRQLETRALQRLRTSPEARKLARSYA